MAIYTFTQFRELSAEGLAQRLGVSPTANPSITTAVDGSVVVDLPGVTLTTAQRTRLRVLAALLWQAEEVS